MLSPELMQGTSSLREGQIPKQTLESLFHLPLKEAAATLGRGTTSFKKICRAAGIAQWPYRKLKCLNSMIGLVSELEIAQQLRADQTEFKVFRHDCMQVAEHVRADSSFKLHGQNFKRVRQATYKLAHQKRQMCLGMESNCADFVQTL